MRNDWWILMINDKTTTYYKLEGLRNSELCRRLKCFGQGQREKVSRLLRRRDFGVTVCELGYQKPGVGVPTAEREYWEVDQSLDWSFFLAENFWYSDHGRTPVVLLSSADPQRCAYQPFRCFFNIFPACFHSIPPSHHGIVAYFWLKRSCRLSPTSLVSVAFETLCTRGPWAAHPGREGRGLSWNPGRFWVHGQFFWTQDFHFVLW